MPAAVVGRVMTVATRTLPSHTITKWQSPVCSALDTARGASPAPTGSHWLGRPQVQARYIAGLREVNHSMSPRASGIASQQTSEHQARATRHDLQHSPRRRGTRPACSHASRGHYGPYLPPERTTAAHVCSMFARMSRYDPVGAGTTRHALSWAAVQSGRSPHYAAHDDTRQ